MTTSLLARWSGVVVAVFLCTAPHNAAAQAARSAPDSALIARADSFTVGDYCRVTRAVTASKPIMTALASDSVIVRVSGATICDPLLSSFSLRALFGGTHAPLAAVARLHTQGTAEARTRIFDAMSEFRATVQSPEMIEAVERGLDSTSNRLLVRVTSTVQSLLTSAARDRALNRLARYERKLGPTSARLNGAEVLLNYAAQRWIPRFRADPLQGPSPWEVIASYTPGYVTRSANRVQPVSAGEFGLRRYLFGDRFGQSGAHGLLYPSYWAAGVITASDRNGALVWPWEGRNRAGGFVSWGSLKVAYIPDRTGSFLFTKQFQAIPFVF
jgi:hypothetical protein